MTANLKYTNRSHPSLFAISILLVSSFSGDTLAQDTEADIAKKLNNPIAAMISSPFQLNYDKGIGSTQKGERTVLNIQPVIPIELNADWNVISRTILPVIQLNDVPPGNDESGIGDITQSLFASPKALTSNG